MNRTFHYHVSPLNWIAVIGVAAAALFFLWNRTAGGTIAGFLLIMADVSMIERIIHTTYTFTDDGMLSICKGRFSRTRSIPVNEITMARKTRITFLMVRYVLIEYGPGKLTSAMPTDEDGFISELHCRQKEVDKLIFDNEKD